MENEVLNIEIVEEIETTENAHENVEELQNDIVVCNAVDYTETLAIVQQNTDYIPVIANDVRVLVVLSVLSFCWSCIRAWRNYSIYGGK